MKHTVIAALASLTLFASCGHAPTTDKPIETHTEKTIQIPITTEKPLKIINVETGFTKQEDYGSVSYLPAIKFDCKNDNGNQLFVGDFEVGVEFIDSNNKVLSVNYTTIHDKALAPMQPLEIIKSTIISHIRIADERFIEDQNITAKIIINNVEYQRVGIHNKIIGAN